MMSQARLGDMASNGSYLPMCKGAPERRQTFSSPKLGGEPGPNGTGYAASSAYRSSSEYQPFAPFFEAGIRRTK